MADGRIRAQGAPVTNEDSRRYDLVKSVMQAQTKVIVEFAKLLVTVSFSAVGVVVALKDKWLGDDPPSYQEVLLGIAVALFLATALVATLAASSYVHRVSLSDYADVDAEVHRVATLRHRLTIAGYGLALAATAIVAAVALGA